ncbi:uncharacterized protein LOC120352301 [Nilaparvata lugens]|uniref:uncharacterized protein LOC120352301 n=1 Tax=Nilaparvata lugens TaxID=108931 RepID=UPI00193E35F9|nr:uncharacterized protein LOC120352301 [Nilaparvata lugens]
MDSQKKCSTNAAVFEKNPISCEEESRETQITEITGSVEAQGDSSSNKCDNIKLDPLENWRQWNDERIKLSKHLAWSLDKKPDSLIMVKVDNKHFNSTNSELIDKAEKYVTFDKSRGDPKFWTTPNYIYDKKTRLPVNCSASEHFDRTQPLSNSPPTMQYVKVPPEIEIEMGSGEFRSMKSNKFHQCDYLNERRRELKANIDLIEEFKPNLDELFIRGHAIKPPSEQLKEKDSTAKGPLIVIEDFNSNRDECSKIWKLKRNVSGYKLKKRCRPGMKHKKKVKINDCLIVISIDGLTYDSSKKTPLSRQPLHNEILLSGCWTNELNKKEIHLENSGCITIRYWFTNNSPLNDPNHFCCMNPSSRSFNRFYFPTNRFVLSPGQKAAIPFYFFTREPGVYKEIWELRSIPKLFAHQTVHINLVGSAVQRSKSSVYLSHIEKHVGSSQKKEQSLPTVVQEMTSETMCAELYSDYRRLFNEEEIFVSKNREQIYRKSLMKILQGVSKQATGRTWSHSINTLRSDILDSTLALEEKRTLLDTLSHALKDRESLTKIPLNCLNERYNAVYQILCCALNHIEEDSEDIRATLKINYSSRRDSEINCSIKLSDSTGQSTLKTLDSSGYHPGSNKSQSILSQRIEPSSSNEQNNVEGQIPSVQLETFRDHKFKTMIRNKTYQRLCTAASEIENLMISYDLIRNKELPKTGAARK